MIRETPRRQLYQWFWRLVPIPIFSKTCCNSNPKFPVTLLLQSVTHPLQPVTPDQIPPNIWKKRRHLRRKVYGTFGMAELSDNFTGFPNFRL